MAVVVIGSVWNTGDQPTAAVLNAKWTSATFATGAVDDSTTALSSGSIIIKDLGVTSAKLAAGAVTAGKIGTGAIATSDIADLAVTAGKMANTLDLSSKTVTLGTDAIATVMITDNAVTHDKVDVATQAEMQAESAAGVATPDTLIQHPGVAKASGVVTFDTSTPVLTGAYHVTLGSHTITTRNFTIPEMADTNYKVLFSIEEGSTPNTASYVSDITTTTFRINGVESADRKIHFAVFGDLA